MHAKAIFTSAVLGSICIASIANAQQRLPRECRQQIVELCGSDRSTIRQCLRERYSSLATSCQSQLRDRMQARRGASDREASQAQAPSSQTVRFGAHRRQAVDYYPATDPASRPPLILFVHGGGWQIGDRSRVQTKPRHFTGSGYAFASTGYRLLPDHPVEDQARDIAAAIAALRDQAGELGFDPDRIVVMGHSAGAHLAALIATDPSYAGEDLDAIKGVVLLDGAGYDVQTHLASAGPQARALYEKAFGTDAQRQAALSPVTHVGSPDAQEWLILHVADRAASADMSRTLAEELAKAGASSELAAIADTDHGRLNREIGTPGDATTAAIDAFLNRLFD